jgi:DNA polymerase-3 subunit gamma/tau
MLLKGIAEVEAAGRPIAAAEMVLVRIAYAADLPTPDEVIRSLGDTARGNGTGAAPSTPAPRADMPARSEMSRGGTRGPLASAAPLQEPVARAVGENAPARVLSRFEDLIALAAEKRDVSLKSALERDVRLVRFEEGQLEIALEASAAKMLVGELSKKLHDWTGRRWMVVVSADQGAPSLRTQAEERKTQLMSDARGDPLVQAVLTRFPGAEIVEVRPPAGNADDVPDTQDNESDLDA